MKLNITVSVAPTISGIPVSTATGFVNIYKNGNAIISGGKLYSSADEARRKSRGKATWQLLGQVSISDYMEGMQGEIEVAAKNAAINACDAKLKRILGITDPTPVCIERREPTAHPIDQTPEPTDSIAKPVSKAKKPMVLKPVGKVKAKAKTAPKAKAKVVTKVVNENGSWFAYVGKAKKKFPTRAAARSYLAAR